MSDWIQIEPKRWLQEELALPRMAYPIRRQAVPALLDEGRLDLQVLIGEIDVFVQQHPEAARHYGRPLGFLAWLAGVEAGREGLLEIAEYDFRLGLEHEPTSISLRLNLALTRQLRGDPEGALDLYLQVLRDPDTGNAIHVRALAARLAHGLGAQDAAKEAMLPLVLLSDDDDLWELLYALEVDRYDGTRAGPPRPTPGRNIAASRQYCPYCGDLLEQVAAYCPFCGAALAG